VTHTPLTDGVVGEKSVMDEPFFGGQAISERSLTLRTGLAAGVPLSKGQSDFRRTRRLRAIGLPRGQTVELVAGQRSTGALDFDYWLECGGLATAGAAVPRHTLTRQRRQAREIATF